MFIWFYFSSCLSRVMTSSCGIDNSPVQHVYEGFARIETYPWLGVLYYPHNKKRFTTSVVLVTRQIVLATALEIDKLPKDDFRTIARVIIGHNCSAAPGVGIRDYNFHPDYSKGTFSAIALVQLETDHVKSELRPICPPPKALPLQQQEFYAMVFSEDCNRSKMTIYKMMLVSTEECKTYYRRTGLGFGVYGPGCEAPARFLDYGMYAKWVQRSVERIGRPAITKIAPNYIVLRRSLAKVQRFGPCDQGEVTEELYTESTEIKENQLRHSFIGKYHFNLTIIGNVEYSCVVLRADYTDVRVLQTPELHLTRYGCSRCNLCFTGAQFIEIRFYVEVEFTAPLKYIVAAYGKAITAIDSNRAHKYANKYSNEFPVLYNHKIYKFLFKNQTADPKLGWYGKKNMTSRMVTGTNNTVNDTAGTVVERSAAVLRVADSIPARNK